MRRQGGDEIMHVFRHISMAVSDLLSSAAAQRKRFLFQVWQGPQNLVHPLNYARFQLADIYPHLDKILYIDPDVVVQADLADMWDAHLQDGKYVKGSCPDPSESSG
jgi:lipopolysaccharide biosynthesis glycosyltransferase